MSKALATKNVAAVLLAVALVFGFAFSFAPSVKAQSVSDLQTQIQALLAQIQGLQGGSSSGGACVNFTFTTNFQQGRSGAEVMQIQKFLNQWADTRVAASGAGSPGNETSFFGPATRAAVIKFQNKYAADILTPVGLSAGNGNWFASTRAKANALAAACVPGTIPPGTPPPVVGGTLQVFAAAQPANSLAVFNAARVPFTNFTLTNSSNVAVTVNGVTVQRTGFSSNGNFAGIVLIDAATGEQVGIARILNSNNQAVLGETFVLQPGQSRSFTVAANMGDALAVNGGEVAGFSVIGINASGTVSGSLPITGAMHTMNDTLLIGQATVARGSLFPASNGVQERAGTANVVLTSVRISAGSQEDIRVSGLRFTQNGTADSGDLMNVRAVIDGVSYPATINGRYYTVNLGSGLVIAKGLSKEAVIRGDIVSGAGRTISMDVDRMTDIIVSGLTYGYGITPGGTNPFFPNNTPVHNENDINITAGQFESISRSNVVPVGNVAPLTPNTNLGAFQISIAGEAVSVNTVRFGFVIVGGPTGVNITNITLVNQNGTVLAGPVDGSATTITGGSSGSVTFNGVEFPAGTTVVTLKGQLSNAFDTNDTIVVSADLSTWSGATGQSTGRNITLVGSASANQQTVRGAALAVTNLPQPAAGTIVSGAQNFVFATALLDAQNSGEDIRVSSITAAIAAATNSATAADLQNVQIWANLSGGAANDSARGDKFETLISNTQQGAATVALTLPQTVLVAKNSAVEIAVVANLTSNAVTGRTYTVDIDAVSASSNSTGTGVTPSMGGTNGQLMTVATGGALTVNVDASSPATSLLLDNTMTEQTIGVFSFTANNVESLSLDKLTLAQNGGTNNAIVSSYRLYNGATPIGTVTNTGAATIEHIFPSNTFVVAAGQTGRITVRAVMNDITGTGAFVNGATVGVGISAAEVRGVSSGTLGNATITDNPAGGNEYSDAATHKVFEAFPTVAFDNVAVPGGNSLIPSLEYRVARLVFTNSGDKDVTFTTAAGNQLVVNFAIGGTTAGSDAVILRDVSTGLTLSTGALAATTGPTFATFTTWANQLTVPAGGSRQVDVFVDTTGLGGAGTSIQASLSPSAAANLEFGVNGTGDFAVGDVVFRGTPTGAPHYRQ